LQIDRVLDLRGRADLSVIWQDQRTAGKPSPTWAFSDAARLKGAQAMLYSSRSRPELSHLVLFDAPELLIRSIGPVVDADAFLHPPG
jgi:hypothetical protein